MANAILEHNPAVKETDDLFTSAVAAISAGDYVAYEQTMQDLLKIVPREHASDMFTFARHKHLPLINQLPPASQQRFKHILISLKGFVNNTLNPRVPPSSTALAPVNASTQKTNAFAQEEPLDLFTHMVNKRHSQTREQDAAITEVILGKNISYTMYQLSQDVKRTYMEFEGAIQRKALAEVPPAKVSYECWETDLVTSTFCDQISQLCKYVVIYRPSFDLHKIPIYGVPGVTYGSLLSRCFYEFMSIASQLFNRIPDDPVANTLRAIVIVQIGFALQGYKVTDYILFSTCIFNYITGRSNSSDAGEQMNNCLRDTANMNYVS